VVQERPPPAAAAGQLPGAQQLADIHAVAGLMPIERGQRRQLPIDRDCTDMRVHRRQYRHRAVSARRRQPQPGHVLADVLQPHLPPIQTAVGQEDPVVLQVVRVGLDGVRGPVDVAEIGEVPLDRLDRGVVVAQDGPRLHRRGGHCHPLNVHRSSNMIHVMDERQITTSSTQIRGAQPPVPDVEDRTWRASDNPEVFRDLRDRFAGLPDQPDRTLLEVSLEPPP